MASDLSRAWRFIYNTLKADAALMALVDDQVHRGAVPAGGGLPAIIYAMIAPGDTIRVLGGEKLWSRPVFKIVAVGQTTNGLDLEPIADGIDRVLDNATGPAGDDGHVFVCSMLRPFELTDRTGAVVYQQLGAEYGITLKAV